VKNMNVDGKRTRDAEKDIDEEGRIYATEGGRGGEGRGGIEFSC
jgi:hypothetical protein